MSKKLFENLFLKLNNDLLGCNTKQIKKNIEDNIRIFEKLSKSQKLLEDQRVIIL